MFIGPSEVCLCTERTLISSWGGGATEPLQTTVPLYLWSSGAQRAVPASCSSMPLIGRRRVARSAARLWRGQRRRYPTRGNSLRGGRCDLAAGSSDRRADE